VRLIAPYLSRRTKEFVKSEILHSTAQDWFDGETNLILAHNALVNGGPA
jgi:hypothetical protein